VIPLRDENPTRTMPIVVIALIIINCVVFFVDQGGARGHVGALAGLAMTPSEIVTGQDVGSPTIHPMWLTLFTSMFMHANLVHIGGNMLYLWIFGNNIEDTLGHLRFLVFYFAGGCIAGLAHILGSISNPIMANTPTVGASGAIAAVLGAYLILFPGARVICLVPFGFLYVTAVPAVVVLALWFLIQILNVGAASGSHVAYWAHFGGFVAGVALILLMRGRGLMRRRRRDMYYPRYE